MNRIYLSLILVLSLGISAYSQSELPTTAEKSDYKSTSTYAEVMEFIDGLIQKQIPENSLKMSGGHFISYRCRKNSTQLSSIMLNYFRQN